jgi:pimeloyl-ACP methyl ester carboxylesterase
MLRNALLLLVIVALIIMYIQNRFIWSDFTQPMNFLVYQQPDISYLKSEVNLWIPKTMGDHSAIPCCFIKHEQPGISDPGESDRNLIVYSHGSGELITSCRSYLERMSSTLACDVVTYDYSGYGLNSSSMYERTPEGVNDTLWHVYDHFINNLKYKRSNTVIMGYALGTGPSLYLTSRFSHGEQFKALVLISAFSSYRCLIRQKSHSFVSKLFRERWNNELMMRQTQPDLPVYLIHGEQDTWTPPSHTTHLASARSHNTFVTMLASAGHQIPWDTVTDTVLTDIFKPGQS